MPVSDIFIARQPIFDRHDVVTAYEILFRSSELNRFEALDQNLASGQSLERTVMGFGFEQLVGDKTAFVNLTRDLLVAEAFTLLPAGRAVIEVLETIAPDPAVLAACTRARDLGYRIALDDFVARPELEPLLALADIVKIDWRDPAGASPEAIDRLRSPGRTILAEKIETPDERRRAEAAGCDLFQGYFFCRPEMLRRKAPSPSRTNHLRLLREVGQQDIDFARVERLIREEVAFSVRLLRYLNSAGFGWRFQVETIQHALRLLGVRELRKWVSAVATVGLAEGKPAELVATALIRARLAELLAEPTGLPRADLDLFLSGLLSVMDVVMDEPLDRLLESMAVNHAVRTGLLGHEPPFGPVLDLVVAQERGDWPRMERLAGEMGTAPARVQEAYRSATAWTRTLLEAA